MNILHAIILAVVEGLTEFLPVSSTGHMVIASSLMGIAAHPFVKVFTVAIQFGAILSVVALYWRRFFQSFGFYWKLVVAFLPAAFFGLLLKKQIDAWLENILVVAFSLMLGGLVLLFIDDFFEKRKSDKSLDVDSMNWLTALKIGFFQVVSMVPGVSRSAATIIGGLSQGLTRQTAAEFSFFLAVPTMFAATVKSLFDFFKHEGGVIQKDEIALLAVGNVVAFAVAWLAIRSFIGFLNQHGFRFFGWYRIAAGLVILILYALGFFEGRRNRRTEAIRGLTTETHLSVAHLVLPLFMVDGKGLRSEVTSLPGTFRLSPDLVLREIEECMKMGLRNFVLFPAVAENLKDKTATHGYSPDNFYLKTAAEIKRNFPECCLISDVAMDPYSSDGHDGLVRSGRIDNDETLPILGRMAVAQAEAGFDILGPSDMMDGRVGHIRQSLDRAGFYETGIMAYTAKYASAFYGPFRDALDSAPKAGDDIPRDKKTYQMNPANRREALIEAALDETEGADFLMVKPALHYLDVISDLKNSSPLPIAAYHVSGECAMLLAACRNGWLDFERAMPEALLSIRRAGADVILTYFAKEFARRFQQI